MRPDAEAPAVLDAIRGRWLFRFGVALAGFGTAHVRPRIRFGSLRNLIEAGLIGFLGFGGLLFLPLLVDCLLVLPAFSRPSQALSMAALASSVAATITRNSLT